MRGGRRGRHNRLGRDLDHLDILGLAVDGRRLDGLSRRNFPRYVGDLDALQRGTILADTETPRYSQHLDFDPRRSAGRVVFEEAGAVAVSTEDDAEGPLITLCNQVVNVADGEVAGAPAGLDEGSLT